MVIAGQRPSIVDYLIAGAKFAIGLLIGWLIWG